MDSNLRLIYSLIGVPIISGVKIILFAMNLALLALVTLSLFIAPLLWKQEIFTVSQGDLDAVVNFKPSSNTLIYDKNNQLISEQFSRYHIYTPYQEIPAPMIDAILSIEDRKFFDHSGIDIYGIARAITSYLRQPKAGISQGASTLTQQVVKNLLLSNEKTIERKLREIILAIALEQKISKEKILEIYCNHIFLGHGAYGIAAASKRYFNKDLKDLDMSQVALIAGLFQSPAKYNPLKNPTLAKKRQRQVLQALLENKKISTQEYALYEQKELNYHQYESLHGKIAPYFVDHVVKQASEILEQSDYELKDSGLKIYTTLDTRLQKLSEQTFNESHDVFSRLDKYIVNTKELSEDKLPSQAAMLVMDRRSGEIVAMQGGRDYDASQFNRATDALRAPGSVFKPITYALALKNGHKWNDLHFVSPITIGNYRPHTANSRLYSETTLLEAFYESINSPAVTIGNQLGVKNVIEFADRLGIQTPIKEEVASLLGSSEVTMLDMARVYSVFANKGQRVNPFVINRIENAAGEIIYSANQFHRENIVLDNSTNELIVEGLKQVITRGTGYHGAHLANYAAGKTGTSNQAKDNWFCGFTDDLVVITWMGHDDQLPYEGHISASNTATILWSRYVEKTKSLLKTAKLSTPAVTQVAHINPRYGHIDESGIPMYFAKDSLPEKKSTDLMFLERGQNTRMDFDEF